MGGPTVDGVVIVPLVARAVHEHHELGEVGVVVNYESEAAGVSYSIASSGTSLRTSNIFDSPDNQHIPCSLVWREGRAYTIDSLPLFTGTVSFASRSLTI